MELAKSINSIYDMSGQLGKQVRRTEPAENGSDEESFEPEYHQIKRLGLKVNKKKICSGNWSSRENQIYLRFMLENTQNFITEKQRRKTKVFYRLSKILKKRTPDQCRSHHQKLQLKYKDDLYSIISEVQKKIQTCLIQEYMGEHQRVHREHFLKMKETQKQQWREEEYRELADQGWFKIKSMGASLKLTIDSNSISEW